MVRRICWDHTHDTQRMERYHWTLEGVNALREKHKPRQWDITLQEQQGVADPERAEALLESTSHLPDRTIPDQAKGDCRLTLQLPQGQHHQWWQGEQVHLDALASEVQGLFFAAASGPMAATQGIENGAGVRFEVDEVVPATALLQPSLLQKQLESHLRTELLCSSFDAVQKTLPTSGSHALIAAVHQAFSQHYPLTLSPDILWITLSQGVALHIQNNAEDLRHLFVQHQGKEKLTVRARQLCTPEDWAEVVQLWTEGIQDHVGQTTAEVFRCDFSTTTDTIRTTSQIVMMDGFREYFDYEVICICGIPEIILEGAVEDWVKLKQKVQRLEAWGLEWWTRHLLPLCDQWIQTAQGNPSRTFWQSIYKPEQSYGPDQITGWLKLLFPYWKERVGNEEKYTFKNPLLMAEQ
ncbi:DUF4419 domain-containing protein [Deinococcus roseus]|uniref:Uncharacterized protein n=1 Tax=Deinococcus roseus TaxID=392414 RepID=A0ABQ2DJA5_9DEIO|nr:DUF4419 domain-containing protein [Deinococcus roseus]GGJ60023.1 hypothetical protein GCM10008938_52680 [Deinococcus roseus]